MERKQLPASVKLIRQSELVRDLMDTFGIVRLTAYRWIKGEGFPAPVVSQNKTSRYWRRADYEAWKDGRS